MTWEPQTRHTAEMAWTILQDFMYYYHIQLPLSQFHMALYIAYLSHKYTNPKTALNMYYSTNIALQARGYDAHKDSAQVQWCIRALSKQAKKLPEDPRKPITVSIL